MTTTVGSITELDEALSGNVAADVTGDIQ